MKGVGFGTVFSNHMFCMAWDQGEGWHDAESKALLEFLYEQAQRPEFTCRFKWGIGSLAMWDNRVTWHRALNDYPGQRRYMHRITLERASLPAGRDVA